MVGVIEYFRLRRHHFSPLPLLLQLRRKAERVFDTRHVATCARIAVPIPSTTYVFASLKHARGQSSLTQFVQQVHAREASTDHHDIKLILRWFHAFPYSSIHSFRSSDSAHAPATAPLIPCHLILPKPRSFAQFATGDCQMGLPRRYHYHYSVRS